MKWIRMSVDKNEKNLALFCRKCKDLEELKYITESVLGESIHISKFRKITIVKEVRLSKEEFDYFSSDFHNEQSWIESSDSGFYNDTNKCIRVINQETGESVLVISEGYDYPRYTALDKLYSINDFK